MNECYITPAPTVGGNTKTINLGAEMKTLAVYSVLGMFPANLPGSHYPAGLPGELLQGHTEYLLEKPQRTLPMRDNLC